MISLKRQLKTRHKLILSVVSALLLSAGWLGAGGFPMFVALVPLMLVSAQYSGSWRDTLRVAGWAYLSFSLWSAFTIWWVWKASPLGPIVSTVVSAFWNTLPFVLYHLLSKYAPKGLAYILLISGWIATEYIFIKAPVMSFPWLTLGNGFAEDTWAVQWYEYTGILGGSLWVLTVNVLAMQALITAKKRMWVAATLALFIPMGISLVLYDVNKPSGKLYTSREAVTASVIQPNVPCYEKFDTSVEKQQENLCDLLSQVPDSATVILMPETSLGIMLRHGAPYSAPVIDRIADSLRGGKAGATVIAGCETVQYYGETKGSPTARKATGYDVPFYYDYYNSAIGIDTTLNVPIHHKGKLVIGVESIPAWFRDGGIFEVDLGGTAGQLGYGATAEPFEAGGAKVAPAICYEGLYGDYMGEYARNGADLFGVISNDGWWGNTPGHRTLFALCRLRAIEHRRDIVRSANTGVSGFITARGDDRQRLEWEQRGVLTEQVRLNPELTFYTRFGDYIGRLSLYIAGLCLLYFIAYLSKKKFYLN